MMLIAHLNERARFIEAIHNYAAHVAFAEKAGALFISCDNKLIKRCLNHKINVWCGNPVAFCEMEDLR